ncbi:hypothetical protein PQQ63_26240 [Paraburkholderia metrosideri]|uniref:Uncharacterized protein n=1 Tax=Paraburkholderia metrosideri TaxID=580937 RepID=A0ABW9DYF0_9BURK
MKKGHGKCGQRGCAHALRDSVHLHYGKFGTTKKPVFDIFKQQKIFYPAWVAQHLLVDAGPRSTVGE